MAFEYVLDVLDGVEQEAQADYEKRDDGKYHFNPDKYAERKASGLKRNNTALKTEKDRFKADYEKLSRFKDVDEPTFEKFLEWQQQQLGEGEGNGKPADPKTLDLQKKYQEERDKAVNKLKGEHQTALTAKEQEVKALTQKVKNLRIGTVLTEFAVKYEVMGDRLARFVNTWSARFDVPDLEDLGKVVFLDDDGEPSTTTPEQAVSQYIRDKEPWWFKASDKGGSGASQSGNGGKPRVDLSKLSATERLKAARRSK